jgi:hypothetical protein
MVIVNKRYLEDIGSHLSSKINTSSKNTPMLNNSDLIYQPPDQKHSYADVLLKRNKEILSNSDTEVDEKYQAQVFSFSKTPKFGT